jgi:hypothetical protein
MPIRLIVNNDCAFQPDQIEVLVTAFEDTLKMLGLVDREDPATLMIAQRISELAKQGERDPVRLREGTVHKLSKRATPMASARDEERRHATVGPDPRSVIT